MIQQVCPHEVPRSGHCKYCAKESEKTPTTESVNQSGPRYLRLTLKKKWFDMIASGEKKEEYREIKGWIISRLHGKTYDFVEFTNGYGAERPKVVLEYRGWGNGIGRASWGATPGNPTIIIRLGRIISSNAHVEGPMTSTNSANTSK